MILSAVTGDNHAYWITMPHVVKPYVSCAVFSVMADRKLRCCLHSLAATLEPYLNLRTFATPQAVVIGGGYIGMEAAAGLAACGLPVTQVCSGQQFMPRLLTPELSAFYEGFYAAKGITIVRGTKPVALEGSSGKVRGGGAPDLLVFRSCRCIA